MDKDKNYLDVDGENVEEAIECGIKMLKTGIENVDVEILNEPKSGFLKFGQKKARVRLTLLTGKIPEGLIKEEEDIFAEQPIVEKKKDADIPVDDMPMPQDSAFKNTKNASDTRIFGRKSNYEGQRDFRQGRDEKAPVKQQEKPAEAKPRIIPEKKANAPVATIDPLEQEKPYEMTAEEAKNIEKINTAFMKLTSLMGFNVEPEVSVLSNKYRIIIKDTPDASLLIGKNGKTIEALQHIVNKIMTKDTLNKPIYLDIKGYVKQKRKNKFEKRWKRERQ